VLGLPHAFLAAGARGVVVTLWRVTDQSAAEFMQEFYRDLRGGRSPAAALLAVRRAHLAASGPASQPYRWAPFVLVGGMR
jgi:CHAT domain-containing protein